ncbi:MAG TPA: TolC family protein [Opitutaceae bacterium]|nr:TolC family protein [Opitutaceae bacterium]
MLFASIGQAAIAAPALSLDDCVKLAAERQPAIAAARAGVAGAQEAVSEARAPYYPQVDLSAGYHRWQRHAFLPSGLALPGHSIPDLIGPLDDWNGGLGSRWMVYDFGVRRAGLAAARARYAGAQADARAIEADVRLGVESAFFGLAAARDVEKVAEKNLERTETHRKLAIARRDAGAVPAADVLRLDAELANARLDLISAQSRVRIASGQLNTAMGRPADVPVVIAPPSSLEPPPGRAELEEAVRRALADRPEIASAAQRADAARAAVGGARADRGAKLHADASYGWRDTAFLPSTPEWQAGLAVDLPIFDGGSRAHHVARTKADLARQEAALAQTRLEVRNEVWTASSELERTWASIAANEASVKASEESLRVVRERYERGAAVITDLLDTQTALARAESSLAAARWNYCAARAAFERAVGASGGLAP